MHNREGQVIVSCCMAEDAIKTAPCATCMFRRDWTNTPSLHEGDPDYCSDRTAVVKRD